MSVITEYSKLPLQIRRNIELSLASNWLSMKTSKPDQCGRYEVFRAGCGKIHYCQWNGSGWAYDHKEITHWRPRVAPEGFNKE